MYQINTAANEIVELSTKGFGELGFKEREHLQEWIAKCPESLGEELLIIQKEFDGYDPENWPEMLAWLAEHIQRMEKVFSSRLPALQKKLKQGIKTPDHGDISS
jgi:hypothetical protein